MGEIVIVKWLKHRTIPKNRAYVNNFLSKCGLHLNRPMNIIKVSTGGYNTGNEPYSEFYAAQVADMLEMMI